MKRDDFDKIFHNYDNNINKPQATQTDVNNIDEILKLWVIDKKNEGINLTKLKNNLKNSLQANEFFNKSIEILINNKHLNEMLGEQQGLILMAMLQEQIKILTVGNFKKIFELLRNLKIETTTKFINAIEEKEN